MRSCKKLINRNQIFQNKMNKEYLYQVVRKIEVEKQKQIKPYGWKCFVSALCIKQRLCAAVVLITASTHSERLQRARGVIDLSLTYFASHRWNSRFWPDSTEQPGWEGRGCVSTKLKGPVMKNTTWLTLSLSLQSANKSCTVLQRLLHNGTRHINPPSEML